MTDAVVASLISGASTVVGVLGKVAYDRMRNTRSHSPNGNGSIERVIATRAEVEFQTRISLLLQQLTAAIEKGHDKSVAQMEAVSVALNNAVQAIRDLHSEIIQQHTIVQPALADTHKIVQEINRELAKQRRAS